MRTFIAIAFASFIFTCISCNTTQEVIPVKIVTPKKIKAKKPKNVILMIADGTGLSQISSGLYYGKKQLNYERFNDIGLIKTSASDNLITDSAASATAYAAGVKTYNGAIGVDTFKNPVSTILEELHDANFSTGVIATSTITHATPGSFYAHVDYRKKEDEIALGFLNGKVNFFAGGGLDHFIARKDGRNLVQELQARNFKIDTTLRANATVLSSKNYGFLLADKGMPRMIDGRGDFLGRATALGIKHLKQDKDGFFLMVEGSQVDWGGHNNDADYLIGELLDFDDVLGQVLDFAEKDGETLVIVTADHETGGFTLASTSNENGGSDYDTINPTFSTGGHSATMVPVFAYGPGSGKFRGIFENTEIYHKIKALTLAR